MELNRARDFLTANNRSVLATSRRDGRPQLSPVNHGVDGEGRLLISSRQTAYKVRNIRRDTRVSVCAVSDGFYGEWVQADGTAEIVSLPDAMELLVDYYRRVAGEHPDWDDYRRAMVADQRCIIRVTLERAGPDRSG
jgi:PPOX class probable F420-dependent enzyme